MDTFINLIENTDILIALGLGCLFSLIVMYLWSQRGREQLERHLLIANEKLGALDACHQECDRLREQLAHANILTAQLQARLEEQQKHGVEKLKLLQDAEGQLKLQFENLANHIF